MLYDLCLLVENMTVKWQPTHIKGRITLLSSYSCKCITVSPPGFYYFLYSQTHAVYTSCLIINAIPFAYIYLINQSTDLINTLQYKIARFWYLKTLNPPHLLCLLKWDVTSKWNNETNIYFLPIIFTISSKRSI